MRRDCCYAVGDRDGVQLRQPVERLAAAAGGQGLADPDGFQLCQTAERGIADVGHAVAHGQLGDLPRIIVVVLAEVDVHPSRSLAVVVSHGSAAVDDKLRLGDIDRPLDLACDACGKSGDKGEAVVRRVGLGGGVRHAADNEALALHGRVVFVDIIADGILSHACYVRGNGHAVDLRAEERRHTDRLQGIGQVKDSQRTADERARLDRRQALGEGNGSQAFAVSER